MKQFYLIVLIFFLGTNFLFCYSDTDTTANGYYLAGMKFVKLGNLNKAEYFLKKSLWEEKTALAEFELAKIYISEKTIRGRAKARKLLTNALFRDPNNIRIRLLKAALMEYFSDNLAFKEYEKILEIDSTNITALFQMGRFKEKDFNDYHKSVFQDNPFSPMLSLEKFAIDDFYESENYYLKILKLEPDNPQALLHLSTLYEDSGKPEKGIPFLERLVKIEPNEYSAHLFLGLLCYKNSQNKRAYEEYKKALSLMSPAEEEDFTFNSVKELIKPIFKDKFKEFKDNIRNLPQTFEAVVGGVATAAAAGVADAFIPGDRFNAIEEGQKYGKKVLSGDAGLTSRPVFGGVSKGIVGGVSLGYLKPDKTKTDKGMMRYAKHLSFMKILGGIANNIDKVLLFHFVGPIQLAIYSFAIAIPDQTKGPLKMLNTMIQAKFVTRTDESIRASMRNKMIWLAISSIAFIALYILIAPYFYGFFFPNYMDAVLYSQIYVVSMLGMIVSPAASYLVAKKKVKKQYTNRITMSNNIITSRTS